MGADDRVVLVVDRSRTRTSLTGRSFLDATQGQREGPDCSVPGPSIAKLDFLESSLRFFTYRRAPIITPIHCHVYLCRPHPSSPCIYFRCLINTQLRSLQPSNIRQGPCFTPGEIPEAACPSFAPRRWRNFPVKAYVSHVVRSSTNADVPQI